MFSEGGTMEAMDVVERVGEGNTERQDAGQSPPLKKGRSNDHGAETRKVAVPKHRLTPLKEHWMKIFTPVVEHLKLQIRFNIKSRNVEIRSSKETEDISNLQKGKSPNVCTVGRLVIS